MKRKKIFSFLIVLIAMAIAGVIMFSDMGYGLTPVMKFFIIFFGLIIGLQCIPAMLMFVGMIRGISPNAERKAVNQSGR